MLLLLFVNVQLYLQARLTWNGSKLLKHLLQAVSIYAAVYVGLSRISDYKHHWSDVLMGAILGTLVAALVVCNILFLLDKIALLKNTVLCMGKGLRNVYWRTGSYIERLSLDEFTRSSLRRSESHLRRTSSLQILTLYFASYLCRRHGVDIKRQSDTNV